MHHFQAQSLRAQNISKAVESIAVFVFALFMASVLPQLLFKYYYANMDLTEQPKLLEYIPVAAFVVGVGYFVYAMAGNFMRDAKAKKLEMQMMEMGCDCENCQCSPSVATVSASTKKATKFKK